MSSAQRADKPAAKPAPSGPFELPPLPWPSNALEPVLSNGAVELHHQTHHRAYIDKLNGLVAGTPYASQSLEEIILATAGDKSREAIFNNAGQAWNHTFYFASLKPAGPAHLPPRLAARIEKDFGSLEKLTAELARQSVARFGSGWGWLVEKDGKLEVTSTSNAESPLATGATPLLALDVWEHAYYLDYHEKREAYARAVLATLVNWDVVAGRLGN